jgi:hypothetical protein
MGLLFYYEAGAPLELSEPGDRFLTSEEAKGIVVRAERRAAGWWNDKPRNPAIFA